MNYLDVGCGSRKISPNAIGIDCRITSDVNILGEAEHLPFKTGSLDKISMVNVLEHFEDPYVLLDEIHRTLNNSGELFVRVPNIGTYSAHLDRTHKFLADLTLWRQILLGYFFKIKTKPFGFKYRDSMIARLGSLALIKIFGMNELAHGFDFICTHKRNIAERRYQAWWMEGDKSNLKQ